MPDKRAEEKFKALSDIIYPEPKKPKESEIYARTIDRLLAEGYYVPLDLVSHYNQSIQAE